MDTVLHTVISYFIERQFIYSKFDFIRAWRHSTQCIAIATPVIYEWGLNNLARVYA